MLRQGGRGGRRFKKTRFFVSKLEKVEKMSFSFYYKNTESSFCPKKLSQGGGGGGGGVSKIVSTRQNMSPIYFATIPNSRLYVCTHPSPFFFVEKINKRKISKLFESSNISKLNISHVNK